MDVFEGTMYKVTNQGLPEHDFQHVLASVTRAQNRINTTMKQAIFAMSLFEWKK